MYINALVRAERTMLSPETTPSSLRGCVTTSTIENMIVEQSIQDPVECTDEADSAAPMNGAAALARARAAVAWSAPIE